LASYTFSVGLQLLPESIAQDQTNTIKALYMIIVPERWSCKSNLRSMCNQFF